MVPPCRLFHIHLGSHAVPVRRMYHLTRWAAPSRGLLPSRRSWQGGGLPFERDAPSSPWSPKRCRNGGGASLREGAARGKVSLRSGVLPARWAGLREPGPLARKAGQEDKDQGWRRGLRAQRKPVPPFRTGGGFQPRPAERRFPGESIKEPPRNVRPAPSSGPAGSVCRSAV